MFEFLMLLFYNNRINNNIICIFSGPVIVNDYNNALHLCLKCFWYFVNAEEFTYLGMFIFYKRGGSYR